MEIKKIYVSLPMKDKEDTIEDRVNLAIDYCERFLPDYDLVFPCNIEQFFGENKTFERDHPYGWYIGEDIKVEFECDAILMTPGWEDSLGCRIEYAIAKERGMEIFHQIF
ncbi:MAG: DUF4406 domain-containing protein [Erysipelotrichales bacterium]|nr:DUF4406 domain-containing protein [Erysipelotrichales bacterium]